MVLANCYTQILANNFLNFKNSKSLKDKIEFMCHDGEALSPCGFFSALVSYVIRELIPSCPTVTQEEKSLYIFLEEMRMKYFVFSDETDEGEFDTALCTCFLESMLNQASYDPDIYGRFIPYLGDKCKEFCRGWDQFTEVRSPGLWADKEWEEALKEKYRNG